jgi:hypothetical protein
MTVEPITNVMTDAVKAADPARFSDTGGSSPASRSTDSAMTAPRTAASGR